MRTSGPTWAHWWCRWRSPETRTPRRSRCAVHSMGGWRSSSSEGLLGALVLAALLWSQPRAEAAGTAARPDAGTVAPAGQGGGRIEDRNLLMVSFEAPSGWKPTQLPSVIKLYSQPPPGLVIDLA